MVNLQGWSLRCCDTDSGNLSCSCACPLGPGKALPCLDLSPLGPAAAASSWCGSSSQLMGPCGTPHPCRLCRVAPRSLCHWTTTQKGFHFFAQQRRSSLCIQQTCIEGLLCTRHCVRLWKEVNELDMASRELKGRYASYRLQYNNRNAVRTEGSNWLCPERIREGFLEEGVRDPSLRE